MLRTRTVACVAVSLLLVAASFLPKKGETVPLILATGGEAPNDSSRSPILSPSGRVAALATEASNLVDTDTDAVRDILVVDLRKGTALCASVSSAGVKADGDSDDPVLDRRGKRVAFASLATNLVDADTNGLQDIFVHDVKSGETLRVSVTSDGTQADGSSGQPSISSSGRLVAFASDATNLVAGDDNGASDIFVHDLLTGVTQLASDAFDGAPADGDSVLPRLSGNGRRLGFISEARNLVPVDGNARRDVFLRDLKTGAIEMVSVASDGSVADGHSDTLSLSATGRRIAFDSRAQNLDPADLHVGLDVFVRDRVKRTTTLVSKPAGDVAADDESTQPAIAGNGRWLAFTSAATNLVDADANAATDIFRLHLKTGAIERVSVSTAGAEADGHSDSPVLSRNGRYVVFSTRAGNLFDGAAADGAGTIALRRP